MTDEATIRHVADALGIDAKIRHRIFNNSKWADSYKIKLGKYQTLDALEYMMPYLVTKRQLVSQLLEERNKLNEESTA